MVGETIRPVEQILDLVVALPGAVFIFRIDTNGGKSFPYAAPNLKRLCGVDPKDISLDASPLFARVHQQDLPYLLSDIEKSWRDLTRFSRAFRYDHPDKGLVWIEMSAKPVREPDGGVVWHGYVQDVSERKRVENALAESEERLHAIIEGADEAIITADDAGTVQTVNNAAVILFGYSRDEIVGRNVNLLMPEQDRERHDSYLRSYKHTGASKVVGADGKLEGRRKDGARFPVSVSISRVSYDDSHVFVGFARDLTAQRMIETHMRQLHIDQLNSVNAKAAALAHEINQPFVAGALYLKAAKRLLRLPEDRRGGSVDAMLDEAAAQMLRAGRIMSRLREFVGGGEPDKIFLNMHDLIRSVSEQMAESARRANVKLSLQLRAERDRAVVDRVQITQVLVNLIRNAEEAMGASAAREIVVSTVLDAPDVIRVDVADTGPGLSDEIKKTLFEPFKTTKQSGMGVGLPISRSIVEAHFGRIWAENRAGGGAIFSFTLPLTETEGE